MLQLRDIINTIFGTVYVMLEAAPVENFYSCMLLILVDAAQVLRLVLQPVYGWSKATYSVARFCDVVFIFTWGWAHVIPWMTFFVLAFLLTSSALVNSVIVARLFRTATVHLQQGPIKLLWRMVTIIVYVLFSSIIQWLLIPIDCHNGELSLSAAIHGLDAVCDPWRVPELLVTVPTIFLIATCVVFACVTSYLVFSVNPRSRGARGQCTGRVELLFLIVKIAVSFLGYLVHCT